MFSSLPSSLILKPILYYWYYAYYYYDLIDTSISFLIYIHSDNWVKLIPNMGRVTEYRGFIFSSTTTADLTESLEWWPITQVS